ncbi:MAG TPA: hypothetical protein VFH90_10950, partial [Candidatus Limnocylindria bacterium]|nr:hypothetical protein [Candidatus Limnocylindria bacterium]
AGRAAACRCAGWTQAEAFAGADAVFVGVVVGPPEAGDPNQPFAPDPATYVFAVEDMLKGPRLDERVEVTSSWQSSACGAEFVLGQRWRVYAGSDAGVLSSSSCSGNELLAEHAQSAVPPSGEGGMPTGVLFAAAGLLAIGAISVWAFTLRGPRAT